jgi:hypothetical protein
MMAFGRCVTSQTSNATSDRSVRSPGSVNQQAFDSPGAPSSELIQEALTAETRRRGDSQRRIREDKARRKFRVAPPNPKLTTPSCGETLNVA